MSVSPGAQGKDARPRLGVGEMPPSGGRLSRGLGLAGREVVDEMGQESCSDKGNLVGVPH